ncbi:MAG: PLP-dependent aminotransferase family protein [Ardenticatenaceae bacterium]|nr:PLP-dependent aminotransferase family protein [Ardenticatenaceae bacterium]
MTHSPRRLPNTLYLSLVALDPASNIPLYRQIYRGVRGAIVDGRLAAGTKLPSTRDLASIWDVSRNTLRNAFDQLIAEGYLEAIVGRGTFVIPQPLRSAPSPQTLSSQSERDRPISVIGRALEPYGQQVRQPSGLLGNAFAVGVPDYRAFPFKIWNRIVNRCQRRIQHVGEPQLGVNGIRPLREAIASYLVSARGLHCTPEQIDVVPGSITGMHIASLALLSPRDQVWMEEPGYINVSGLLRYRGVDLVPVPVDQHGLDVPAAIKQAPEARLAYVTPSHQYPLGVTMSLPRRQQLLDWAGRHSLWIFEDDYDSEFRYDGPPLTALQGLDQHDRVIYFGSFSKIMLPDLRLGYVVLPPDLVDVYTGVKLPLSISSPLLIQQATAEFMLDGHFVRHIRRMRQHYKVRRDALVEAITRHLAGAATLGALECGLHIVVYLADHIDEAQAAAATRQLGMAVLPLSGEYFGRPLQKGLVFGFANVPPEDMDGYIKRLAAVIL